MKAKFKCLQCLHQWETKPGPNICPQCGYNYVKWLNYDELREIWNEERATRGEEPI